MCILIHKKFYSKKLCFHNIWSSMQNYQLLVNILKFSYIPNFLVLTKWDNLQGNFQYGINI